MSWEAGHTEEEEQHTINVEDIAGRMNTTEPEVFDGPDSPDSLNTSGVFSNSTASDGQLKEDIEAYLRELYQEHDLGLHNRLSDMQVEQLFVPSVRWPADLKRFVNRYQHEHNLYNISDKERGPLRRFVGILKGHLNMETRQSVNIEEAKILAVCTSRVSTFATEWRRDGFITRTRGQSEKIPLFQKLWKTHRDSWVAKIKTQGVSERALGKRPAEPIADCGLPRSAKKIRSIETDDYLPYNKSTKKLSAKRQRTSQVQAGSSSMPAPKSSAKAPLRLPRVTPRQPSNKTTNLLSMAHTERFQAPEVPMVDHARPATPLEQIEVIPGRYSPPSLGVQRFPSHAGTEEQVQEVLELLERVPSETSISASRVNARIEGSGTRQSMLPVKGQNMRNTASGVTSQMSKSIEPASIRKQKPELFFILADWDLAQDEPLRSKDVFRDSSLKDFFALVCGKVGRNVADVDNLNLEYEWTLQRDLVAYASMSNAAWEDLKDKVLENFKMSRKAMTEKEKFHIWVRCRPEEKDD